MEIFLPDGRLDATLADAAGMFSLPIRITGNGTFSVTVDGETTDYVGPRDAFLLDKKLDLHAHTLAFVYVPGENDGGGAYLGSFVRNYGTMLILR